MRRKFSIRPGVTFKGRQFKGLRGWAGKPSHPPLTDVPVGAYVLVAVFDVISRIAGNDSTVGAGNASLNAAPISVQRHADTVPLAVYVFAAFVVLLAVFLPPAIGIALRGRTGSNRSSS